MKKLRVVLIVLVVLVVVVIAAIELGGRPVLASYIRGQIVKSLPGSDPTVTIGSGSLTLQALSGHLDSVDVDIPSAKLGTLTSHLTFAASDVPLDSNQAIGNVKIDLDATQAEAQTFVRSLDNFEKASVKINNDVSIGSSFAVFGQTIPFAIGVQPKADAGELVLTPTSVTIEGSKVSLADVKKLPLASNILSLIKPQKVCVAQYLPKVLTLTGVSVAGDHLKLAADGTGIALATTDFSAVGSCG
jgi:LmeA-like phospholipid-binding